MSKHLKATVVSAVIFGILTVMWDLLIDKPMSEALLHALVMTPVFGISIYLINRKKRPG